MAMAIVLSEQSTCAYQKQGAIIADHAGNIVGTGYNGVSAQSEHCYDYWKRIYYEKGLDTTCGEFTTFWFETEYFKRLHKDYEHQHEIHAIMNAILRTPIDALNGATLYTTHPPCTECAKIIQAVGIQRVMYVTKIPGDGVALAHLHKHRVKLDYSPIPEE